MTERIEVNPAPGKAVTIRNTTSEAKVVEVLCPDGTKVRCVVIPGHGVSVTRGFNDPPAINMFDADHAGDLIGTPNK